MMFLSLSFLLSSEETTSARLKQTRTVSHTTPHPSLARPPAMGAQRNKHKDRKKAFELRVYSDGMRWVMSSNGQHLPLVTMGWHMRWGRHSPVHFLM
eukprot:8539334-Pyramimonas_sp.AAC.1